MNSLDEKKTRVFNITIISLSLLLHIVVILLFFLIPPQKRSDCSKKTFNMIELQQGTPDVQPKTSESKPVQKKPKTIEPQKVQSQPTVEPKSNPVIETPQPEVITSENVSDIQNAISVPQGTAHPEPGPSQPQSSQTMPQQLSSQQLGSAVGTVDAGVTGLVPIVVYGPKPAYPQIAEDLGITGTVTAIITIDEKGNVTEVIIKDSPHKSMSDEVKRKLLTWKFKPMIYKGESVILKRVMQEIEYN